MKRILTILLLATATTAQQGGQFGVTGGLIANGGGNSTAGQYGTSGTIGQSIAGTQSNGGTYGVSGGFWQPAFAPSAALASVSGRVSTANGAGIKSVIISIRDASGGNVLTTITGPFGYYRFDGLEAGRSYIIILASKRFTFASSPMLVNLGDEIVELDWSANP